MRPAFGTKCRTEDHIKECMVGIRVRSWNTLNGSLKGLDFILRMLGNSLWVKQESSLTGHNDGGNRVRRSWNHSFPLPAAVVQVEMLSTKIKKTGKSPANTARKRGSHLPHPHALFRNEEAQALKRVSCLRH